MTNDEFGPPWRDLSALQSKKDNISEEESMEPSNAMAGLGQRFWNQVESYSSPFLIRSSSRCSSRLFMASRLSYLRFPFARPRVILAFPLLK